MTPSFIPTPTRSKRAFTLIELLVVILVIAILIAVAAPSLLGQQNKAHDSAIKQGLTIGYKASKSASLDNTPQGGWATGSSLVTQIRDAEPQLDISLTDDPARGALGVCADSSAETLKLVGLSASGTKFLLSSAANSNLVVEPGSCGAPLASTYDSSNGAACGAGAGPQTTDLFLMSVGSSAGLPGKSWGDGYTQGFFTLGSGNPASNDLPSSYCYTTGGQFSVQSGYLTHNSGLYVIGRDSSDMFPVDSFIPVPAGASAIEVSPSGVVSYFKDGGRHNVVARVTLAVFSLYDAGGATFPDDELRFDLGGNVFSPTWKLGAPNIGQPNDGEMYEPIVGP